MAYDDIIVQRTASALEIAINRPDKLNAIREQTAVEIMAAMGEVEMDRAIVGVILHGSEKAFCTGVDTSEFKYVEANASTSTARASGRGRPSRCSASSWASPSR